MNVAVGLTRRQQDILESIRRYTREHGMAPTMDELGEMLGIRRVTVFEHINRLEDKGWITRSKRQSRSIRIKSICSECGRAYRGMLAKLADGQTLGSARGNWLASDEGRTCKGVVANPLLEERLKAAFDAGWRAARHAVESPGA